MKMEVRICDHPYMDRGNACALCQKELEAKVEQLEAQIAAVKRALTWDECQAAVGVRNDEY